MENMHTDVRMNESIQMDFYKAVHKIEFVFFSKKSACLPWEGHFHLEILQEDWMSQVEDCLNQK